MRRRLAADVRARVQSYARAGLQDDLDRLASDLNGLAERVRSVDRHSSPKLWNDLGVPIADTLGTITDAVRAVAPDDGAFSEALDHAVDRFADCAQGPLLAAIAPEELRALVAADLLPVPPAQAREGYFEGDDMSYWTSGLGDRLLLEDVGRRLNRPLTTATRLLDFGSSSGRVLRHFANAMPEMRAFGVDLGCQSVAWAREHLHPAVTVVQGTTIPHLPFADGFFDCIFAGSVFTHIADFEEAWLLELLRVLAPDGFAVLTFHPERTWTEMGRDPNHWVRGIIKAGPHRLDPGAIEPVSVDVFEAPMPADRVVLTMTALPVNNANVFHSHAWIRERWGRVFDLQWIVPRAHAVYQDAAVLTRPA